MNAGILGLGACLPEKIVTNQDIIDSGIDTSEDWIVSRTGIRQRHVTTDDESAITLALPAAQQALRNAGCDATDLDLIIVGTSTADYRGFPSTACLLQNELGARHVGAFDLAAACSGFSYALTVAKQFVENNTAKRVLVLGVDTLSKYIDWEDRSICILFGDGAGAAVVGDLPSGYGILSDSLYANGGEADILKMESGGSKCVISESQIQARNHLIHMDGRSVFKVAVSNVVDAIKKALITANLSIEDIDKVALHQANMRIVKTISDKTGIPLQKFFINVDRYGNTSAASIPIALSEAVDSGDLKRGDQVLSAGFGAGFTWATHIMKWSY